MSAKAILSLMFFVSVLVSGSLFVSGQTRQITQQPERRMPDMRLPVVSFPAGKSLSKSRLELKVI